jgi:hypothetical protein
MIKAQLWLNFYLIFLIFFREKYKKAPQLPAIYDLAP